MDKRRLAQALTSRARRAQAALLWSGGLAGRVRPPTVPVARRNSDDMLRFNLDAVTAALEAAGLNYFVVPGWPAENPRVGVLDADGATILVALRDADAGAPLYVKAKGLPAARADAANPRYLTGARIVRVFAHHTVGPSVVGREYACLVELWTRADGLVVGPRPNAIATKVPEAFAVAGDVDVFGRRYRTWQPFDLPTHADRMPFDIDLVYTWVDGSDPAWLERLDTARREAGHTDWHRAAANRGRYQDREELRYSLRSVWMYANFFRRIHIVTDRQMPAWLHTDDRVRVVDHREIFGESGRLPTFNSHAIESRLHHIDDLAEHFVYANDDMFLGRRLSPHAFFFPNGVAKFLPAPFVLDEGPRSPSDNPAEVAGKNNRALLRHRWPNLVTHKLRHAPYPLLRSVLEEMEKTYPQQFEATASHQFRHPDDHSVASSLFSYYAYLQRRALPAQLSFRYVDISRPSTRDVATGLRRIERDRPQVFCLNDVEGDVPPATETVVRTFLSTMFPVPSPYER